MDQLQELRACLQIALKIADSIGNHVVAAHIALPLAMVEGHVDQPSPLETVN